VEPKPPAIGLRHSKTITVVPGLTVPHVSPEFGSFSDMPPVFATAFMVGFVEVTCIEALKPHLAAGQRTVGTRVDMSHSAATPVGMTVTAAVELVAIEGKRLRFRVECRDDFETIGSGHHERFIVDAGRFLARVDAKAARPR
jgi:fluoroacetyl-CoA thioesterase